MKRMVENSEKIEELVDIVKIENGDIVTSKITTTDGDKIYIYSNNQAIFDNNFPGSIILHNLGTALIFEAYIQSGTQTGNYPIARILSSDEGLSYVKLSNGDEFKPSVGAGDVPDDYVITTDFNETLADKTRSEYRLVLLIGHYCKEI